MKIVLFTYLTLEYGGGVAKYFTEVTTGLKKRFPDLEITIVTFDEKLLNKVLFLYSLYFFGKQDRNIYNKEKISTIKEALENIKYKKATSFEDLKRELQRHDLIYTTNNLLEVFIIAYLFGYKSLPPVIYGFHIPIYYKYTPSIQSKLHNFIYSSPFYINAISKAKKLHVCNKYDDFLLKKVIKSTEVVKVYYPFNFEEFEKKAEKFQFKPVIRIKDKFNIVWSGRLTEQKGVRDLTEIINQVNLTKASDKIAWYVIGEGELKEKLLDLVKKWNNVHYLGYVDNNYIASILKSCDLFISTSKWESFPYNILEAQSLGLPVICYDIPGCEDIIEDSRNGFIVKSRREFVTKVKNINKYVFNKSTIKSFVMKKFNCDENFRKMYKLLSA